MFGSGSKPSLGLSISTSTANAPSSLGASTSQPAAGGSLFGGFGPTSTSTSKPQQPGGLFGTASQQPSQAGGLFGSATSQPSQPASGSLFTSMTSQATGRGLFGAPTAQPASGGLFANTTSQPSQSGGLFGTTASQPAGGSGLFGTAKTQPAPTGGLFASAPQPAQGGGLFGTASTQAAPSGGLLGVPPSQTSQGGSLFAGMASQPSQGLFSGAQAPQQSNFFGGFNQSGAAKPAGSLNLGQQATLGASTSSARIDLEHLRPTTKFDQLAEDLQREIVNLDTAILNEMHRCNEVSDLLPTIAASGSNIANDVTYVTRKLEEVETGLENDAEDIQNLKENTVKKDAEEAKICFREVDRLKMPSQYQASVGGPTASVSGGVYGGHGLSGWWNHPQTLQRSMRQGTGAGSSRALQLPGDEDEESRRNGPANIVDFFDRRGEEMRKTLAENKALLLGIETFVTGVESKIAVKEREVMGREGRANSSQEEEDPVGLLRYVFGEFERSLYEVADKVGEARDGVQDLVMGGLGGGGSRERLAW